MSSALRERSKHARLNNSVLGYQRHAEEVKFGRHTNACHLTRVDHAAIARACGCHAETIDDPVDIAPALARALDAAGPYLLDVITDPQAYPPLTMFETAFEHNSRI